MSQLVFIYNCTYIVTFNQKGRYFLHFSLSQYEIQYGIRAGNGDSKQLREKIGKLWYYFLGLKICKTSSRVKDRQNLFKGFGLFLFLYFHCCYLLVKEDEEQQRWLKSKLTKIIPVRGTIEWAWLHISSDSAKEICKLWIMAKVDVYCTTSEEKVRLCTRKRRKELI